MNGDAWVNVPDTKTEAEKLEVETSARQCGKTGLHNPFKNILRYKMLGDVF